MRQHQALVQKTPSKAEQRHRPPEAEELRLPQSSDVIDADEQQIQRDGPSGKGSGCLPGGPIVPNIGALSRELAK